MIIRSACTRGTSRVSATACRYRGTTWPRRRGCRRGASFACSFAYLCFMRKEERHVRLPSAWCVWLRVCLPRFSFFPKEFILTTKKMRHEPAPTKRRLITDTISSHEGATLLGPPPNENIRTTYTLITMHANSAAFLSRFVWQVVGTPLDEKNIWEKRRKRPASQLAMAQGNTRNLHTHTHSLYSDKLSI